MGQDMFLPHDTGGKGSSLPRKEVRYFLAFEGLFNGLHYPMMTLLMGAEGLSVAAEDLMKVAVERIRSSTNSLLASLRASAFARRWGWPSWHFPS